MMQEIITINHEPFIANTKCVDDGSWFLAYERGYREPRYPVPAHRYGVLIRDYCVEITTGITKQWYPTYPAAFQGPYHECELVFYVQMDFPEDFDYATGLD